MVLRGQHIADYGDEEGGELLPRQDGGDGLLHRLHLGPLIARLQGHPYLILRVLQGRKRGGSAGKTRSGALKVRNESCRRKGGGAGRQAGQRPGRVLPSPSNCCAPPSLLLLLICRMMLHPLSEHPGARSCRRRTTLLPSGAPVSRSDGSAAADKRVHLLIGGPAPPLRRAPEPLAAAGAWGGRGGGGLLPLAGRGRARLTCALSEQTRNVELFSCLLFMAPGFDHTLGGSPNNCPRAGRAPGAPTRWLNLWWIKGGGDQRDQRPRAARRPKRKPAP